MMFNLVRSELLKIRHTVSMKLPIAAPIVTLVLGYVLSGKSVQFTAYNWWYTMIFPVSISVWSTNAISREKDTHYQNLLCLPIDLKKLWIGKLTAIIVLALFSSLLMCGGCTAFGAFTKMNINLLDGFFGCMLLFVAFLWQIPVVMWVAKRMGHLAAILLSVGCNMVCSMAGAESGLFFLNPFAIPARIVCPFFKMHPNGLPLENNSVLFEKGMILHAVCISLLLFILLSFVTARLFAKGEKNHD